MRIIYISYTYRRLVKRKGIVEVQSNLFFCTIINSLYDYSGNSSIAASERTIYIGSLSVTNKQKTQIANKNWVLSTSSQT